MTTLDGHDAAVLGKDTLRKDTRGAVLVLGVALGALLVAALWQVVGVAEAMIWRETAQDAADAVAFEHAIWSARGMNVIAMVNIVMSLVMFVMVVWRTALVALAIAMLLTLPASLLALPVAEELLLIDYRIVAPTVIRIVSALNVVEMGVASATPVLASFEATRNTGNAFGADTSAYSLSLIPNVNLAGVETAVDCLAYGSGGRGAARGGAGDGRPALPGGSSQPALPGKPGQPALPGSPTQPALPGSPTRPALPAAPNRPALPAGSNREPASMGSAGLAAAATASGRMGMPVSLPVQDDSFSLLCNKGGSFAWNNAAGMMEDALALVISDALGDRALANALVLPLDLARNATGFVTGLLPGVFCAPLGDAPISLDGILRGLPVGEGEMDGLCEEGLRRSPRRFQGSANDGPEEIFQDPLGSEWIGRSEWLGRCRDRGNQMTRSSARRRFVNAFNGIALALPETQCGKPAKVWEYAGNGNVFLRSFGSSRLPGSSAAGDAGLELADGEATGNVVAAAPGSVSAHAEMYFDCEGPWGLSIPVKFEDDVPLLEQVFRSAVPGEACGPDAMWKMRWQARLRRVHAADTLLGADLNSLLYGFMRQGPANFGDFPLADWASQVGSGWLSNWLDGLFKDEFQAVLGVVYEDVLGLEDLSVGDVLREVRPRPASGQEPDELWQFLDSQRDRSATLH